MELHVFVTNDRYTIRICDKNARRDEKMSYGTSLYDKINFFI